MTPPSEEGKGDAPLLSLYAVVVLYRMAPEHCTTLKTLRAAWEHARAGKLRLKILVYDNTPEFHQSSARLPQEFEYMPAPGNGGLAPAYNLAAQRAAAHGFDWLLTLDQDTELPLIFLERLAQAVTRIGSDQTIGAIVPHLREGDRRLSPKWFALEVFARSLPDHFDGVPTHPMHAFNSAGTLRLRALERIGGFHPMFWLDYSDAYIYRSFQQQGIRVYVAGALQVEHHLSILDVAGRMSEERYRNMLEAGSSFTDLLRGPVASLAFTLGLIRSCAGQLLRRTGSANRRSILLTLLRERLFNRKAARLFRWEQRQKQRIAQTDTHRQQEQGR